MELTATAVTSDDASRLDDRAAARTTDALPTETPPSGGRPVHARLPVLDLLRFLAATAVVGYHVLVDNGRLWGNSVAEHLGPVVPGIFRYGWLGVEFFFVISGFVICMSSWGRSISQFVTSRITRLMPAYVFAVLVTGALLTIWPLADGRPEPSHVIINMTMLQQFLGVPNIDNVYWTLFIELKFYLIFAVVVAFGVTYRRVVIFCGAWLTASLFALSSGGPLLTALTEPRYAAYFVIGITLYLIHRFGANLLLWGMFGVSVAVAVRSLTGRVADQNVDRHLNDVTVAAAAMAIFLLVMVGVAVGWFNWLRWSGLVALGALTYPMYLLHMNLSRIMLSRLSDKVAFPLLLALILATVLALAVTTNRLVERPGARLLGNRLTASFAAIRSADEAGRNAPRGHLTPRGGRRRAGE